uniref:Uncharacterized protein n=1 Tax=Rhizophora mucronata TaxID=61149 RepID=A0A2P2L7C2_RHIMU
MSLLLISNWCYPYFAMNILISNLVPEVANNLSSILPSPTLNFWAYFLTAQHSNSNTSSKKLLSIYGCT